MEFSFNSDELDKNLNIFSERLDAALLMYGQTAAKGLESKAKQNRPWTDRTSRARQGLTGSIGKTGDNIRIVLAHTVDYGLWLELAHEKKYAIVEPTVRLDANEVIMGMNNLLDKVRF